MHIYSLTWRPNISDNIIFEETLPILISSFNRALKFCYSVEKDGTKDRHLHAHLWLKGRSDNFFRTEKKKLYEIINKSNTIMSVAWKCPGVKEDSENHNLKYNLGYVQKEGDKRKRYGQSGFTEEYLEECKQYYYDNKVDKPKTSNYRFVDMTKNNIKTYILDFCHEIKEAPNSGTLRKMLKQGYCNSNLPQNSLRRILLETKSLYGEELTDTEILEYDTPSIVDKTDQNELAYLRQEMRTIKQLIYLEQYDKIKDIVREY